MHRHLLPTPGPKVRSVRSLLASVATALLVTVPLVTVPLVTIALPGGLRAQGAKPAASQPSQQPYVVGIVGASVSAGACYPFQMGVFGERDSTKRLAEMLQATMPTETGSRPIQWIDAAQEMTFQAPYERLPKQVAAVTEQQVDAILAVDFLFWMGYGPAFPTEDQRRRLATGKITVHDLRLETCKHALKMVDTMRRACSGPILIGDFPDMTGAARQFMADRWIPPAATRTTLNKMVRDFADAREDVVLLSLDQLLSGVKADGYEFTAEGKRFRASFEQLMQWERLHPNQVGIAVITDEILKTLVPALPDDSPLKIHRPPLTAMLKLTGGIDYLQDLEQLGPVEPAEAGGGK